MNKIRAFTFNTNTSVTINLVHLSVTTNNCRTSLFFGTKQFMNLFLLPKGTVNLQLDLKKI